MHWLPQPCWLGAGHGHPMQPCTGQDHERPSSEAVDRSQFKTTFGQGEDARGIKPFERWMVGWKHQTMGPNRVQTHGGSQCFTPNASGGATSIPGNSWGQTVPFTGRWTHQPNPHFKQFLACMCTSRRTLDLRDEAKRGRSAGRTRALSAQRTWVDPFNDALVARHGRWERGGHLQHRRAGVLGCGMTWIPLELARTRP